MTIRSSVISLAKKTAGLRHRVIAHRKSGTRSTKLERAYTRAQADLGMARADYEREKQASLRLKAAAVAKAEIARGVFEQGGNNRGPQVEAIIKYAGGDVGEPWCVDGVIWCYGHAGSEVVKPGFPRAVRLMYPQPGVVKTLTPRDGDIVRFIFDHTGLFVRDNGNGTITTREFNTGPTGAVSDGNGGDGAYEKVRAKSLVRDYLRVTA